MRRASIFLSGLLLLACRKEPEEERLHTLLDSVGVHVYVGLKAVWSDPDGREDTRRAHAAVTRLLAREADHALDDALTIGDLLWNLRSVGRDEVELGRSSQLPPPLVKLRASLPDAVPVAVLDDRPTNHGALLLALVLMQISPSPSPLPIDAHAALYEAYMAGEDPLAWKELEPTVRAAQVFVYGGAGLCERAGRGSDALAREPLPAAAPLASLHGLTGLPSSTVALDAAPGGALMGAATLGLATLPWTSRLLAHVAAARCFEGRSEQGRAEREWQRATDVLAGIGAPESELALLRAYVAYRAEDFPNSRAQLELASRSKLFSEGERRELVTLADELGRGQQGAVSRWLDSARVARFSVALVHDRLSTAGVYGELARQLSALAPVHELLTDLNQASAVTPAGLERSFWRLGWEKIERWFRG